MDDLKIAAICNKKLAGRVITYTLLPTSPAIQSVSQNIGKA